MLILFYFSILMLDKLFSIILGIIICFMYGKNLFERKTIILNSSRMKRLNKNVIKVDNRCYKFDKNEDVTKCSSEGK